MGIRVIFLMLVVMGSVSCATTNQSVATAGESVVADIQSVIETKNYAINVYEAAPVSMRSVQLSSGYYLRVTGSSVDCHLPYFGRVYTPAALGFGSGGERLTFRAAAEDYITTKSRNGATNIYFSIRTEQDRYRFELQIHRNGNSSITVRPMSKQQISFYGNLAR